MNGCTQYEALLPFYAAGTLGTEERVMVAAHLARCPACRAELALWRASGEILRSSTAALPPPATRVLQGTLQRIHRQRHPIARAWTLLCAQVPLVRRELWLASALVMGLGVVIGLLAGAGPSVGWAVQALAPLAAAVGVAVIYGPEEDPTLELALATPTSPRQVLLARLALVYGYNLCLALAASVALLPVMPAGLLGSIIIGWLAPMTFLSALALVLSLLLGTTNAISIALGIWMARGLASILVSEEGIGVALSRTAAHYVAFWHEPALLLGLSLALLLGAIWLCGRPERQIAQLT